MASSRRRRAASSKGVSRRTVLELCEALAIPLRVGALPADTLADADEVFLSSTGGGVLPIAKVDGKPVGAGFPGPVTQRLHDAYWALHDDPRHRDPVVY
jgi:branched-chain amino acid aminotransferase